MIVSIGSNEVCIYYYVVSLSTQHQTYYHREDGPAIEYTDGHKEWWINGKLHRLDGPAVEWNNGNGRAWYHEGKHVKCNSQYEFERLIKLKAFW